MAQKQPSLSPPQKNHLSGLQRKLLKVSFYNVQQLNEAKREIAPIVSKNRAKARTTAAYTDLHRGGGDGGAAGPSGQRGEGSAMPVQVGFVVFKGSCPD